MAAFEAGNNKTNVFAQRLAVGFIKSFEVFLYEVMIEMNKNQLNNRNGTVLASFCTLQIPERQDHVGYDSHSLLKYLENCKLIFSCLMIASVSNKAFTQLDK